MYYKKYPDVSRQASPATISNRLSTIFSYTGKRVGINALRSSYVSYMNSEVIKNGKQLTVKQKEKWRKNEKFKKVFRRGISEKNPNRTK